MTKRLNLWLFALLLIFGLPTYWLMLDNRPGDARAKPVSIAQLRQLAASKPGQAPTGIRYEAVGRALRMGNLSAAGTGFRLNRIYIFSYQLEFPGGPPIIIGSGLTSRQAEALNFLRYYDNAQARVFAALRRASHVVTLGPEPTQTGGLRFLERTEPPSTLPDMPGVGESARTGNRPYALAPGVVIIPTPDRFAGTRLVYARLSDGREYIFAGTLSRQSVNWKEMRIPGRLITDVVQPENRREAFSWLLTLRKLKAEAPGLVIVSSHRVPGEAGLEPEFRVDASN